MDISLLQRRGWKLIPLYKIDNGNCSCGDPECKAPGKHPKVSGWPQKASNNAMQHLQWFADDTANVGVVTGNGLIVLDIDAHKGGFETLESLPELPDTLQVSTRNGGRHYYFKGNGRNTVEKVGPGINTRGDGEYVVAPPSQGYDWYDGEGYEDIADAPEWLSNILKIETANEQEQIIESDIDYDLVRIWLAHIPADERDDFIRVGFALYNETGGAKRAFSLWQEWAAKSDKHDLRYTLNTWESFRTREGSRSGLGTIEKLARTHGYSETTEILIDEESEAIPEIQVINGSHDQLSFPHPEMLQLFIEWVLDSAFRKEPTLAAHAGIAVLGQILGNVVHTNGIYTNTWMVSLGKSGIGKEMCRKAATALLASCDLSDRIGGEDLTSDAALMARLAQNNHAFFNVDEFGDKMRQAVNAKNFIGQSLLTAMVSIFTKSGSTLYGKEYANQKERARVDIYLPMVTFLCSATEDQFRSALQDGLSFIRQGVLNRMLLCNVQRYQYGSHDQGFLKDPPEKLLRWAKYWSSKGPLQQNIEIAENAKRLLVQYDKKCVDIANSGGSELWVRGIEQVKKLALIAACSDSFDDCDNEPIIELQNVEWGIDYVTRSLMLVDDLIMNKVAKSEYHSSLIKIEDVIKNAGSRGITERELLREPTLSGIPRTHREACIKDIQAAGKIKYTNINTARKGRSRNAYIWICS